MGFADWLLGNRTVSWSRDPRLMAFRIEVARRDGSVVEKMITEEQLQASRLAAIELVQRLFDHPLDRIAVGLVARREWFADFDLRALVAAGAITRFERELDANLRQTERNAAAYAERPDPAPEDAAYRENSEKSMWSPRQKRPSLAEPNPALPLYDPR